MPSDTSILLHWLFCSQISCVHASLILLPVFIKYFHSLMSHSLVNMYAIDGQEELGMSIWPNRFVFVNWNSLWIRFWWSLKAVFPLYILLHILHTIFFELWTTFQCIFKAAFFWYIFWQISHIIFSGSWICRQCTLKHNLLVNVLPQQFFWNDITDTILIIVMISYSLLGFVRRATFRTLKFFSLQWIWFMFMSFTIVTIQVIDVFELFSTFIAFHLWSAMYSFLMCF